MISIGSDHGGFALKQEIMEFLKVSGYEYTDEGCYEPKSVDYPDIAKLVCDKGKGKAMGIHRQDVSHYKGPYGG